MQFHPKDLSELDDLTEEHLGFSALSDGLGFAKSAKKAPSRPATPDEEDEDEEVRRKSLSGTGAVAAGPARPVPSYIPPGARTAATAGAAAAYARAPGAATPRAATSAASATASVLAEPAAPQWQRVSAFLLDAAIIFVPLALAWWFSFRGDALELFRADRKPPLALFGVVFAAYFLLSESFGGQSLGKMMLGLRVVEDDKYQKPTGLRHASARLVLFLVGIGCAGAGLLASFLDPKRRPWHDRYSGSIVRRKA